MTQTQLGVCASFVLLVAGVSGQSLTQYRILDRLALPTDLDPPFKMAAGDVNGDRAPDLVFANMGSAMPGYQNRLYLNDGYGSFTDVTATSFPAVLNWTGAVALGDVDGDGDLDIFFGNSGTQGSLLYQNDGKGKFTDVTATNLPAIPVTVYCAAFFDMDGDKDLDLCARDRLFENDGKGVFKDVTANAGGVHGSWGMATGDVDGDGDVDLMFGQSTSARPILLWLNDGKGKFSDASSQMPSIPTGVGGDFPLVDVDGDKDLDVFLPGYGGQPQLWLNDGKGTFTDATATGLPVYTTSSAYSSLAGDVDLDGDADLILVDGTNVAAGKQTRIYVNNGVGVFADGSLTRSAADARTTVSAVLSDVDLDGDPDLVLGNWFKQNNVWHNLHRHCYAEKAPAIGQNYVLDYYARPGYTTLPQTVLPFGGGLPLLPRVNVPPYGFLGVHPLGLFFMPSGLIAPPGGKYSFTIPIPNDNAFKGIKLYWQALVMHVPQVLMSNPFADQIQ